VFKHPETSRSVRGTDKHIHKAIHQGKGMLGIASSGKLIFTKEG